MHIETTGTARIRDKATGTIYEIEADDLDWQAIGSSERQMGPETEYSAEVDHPALGLLEWYLWEYPAGAENYQDQRLNGHELVENFAISLVADPDPDEEGEEDSVESRTGPTIYYSDDDEIGVTAEGLGRLDPEAQVPYLTHWFFSYYEDPAQETPYNSAEGGYLYIHGGPYDAREELDDEFAEFVSEGAIAQAVETVQEDGTLDWAPHPNHPSRQDEHLEQDEEAVDTPADRLERHIDELVEALEQGRQPDYGSPAELELRTRVKEAFDQLEAELPPEKPVHGGMGHNNPPPDERFTADELSELRQSVAAVQGEIAQEKPDAVIVAKQTSVLLRIARRAGELAGMGAEEFAKAFGKSLGEAAGKGIVSVAKWGLIGYAITAVIHTVPWLNTILHFF